MVWSVIVNLTILGFFKYFNFFIGSAVTLLNKFGIPAENLRLDIILPVGISFYTFQSMSYIIDIYRKEVKPTKDFLDFAVYVSFFPHLVAGPIMRAKLLLPQILNKRVFSWPLFYEGCYLMFWGFFKKLFIADNVAGIAKTAFSQYQSMSGADVLIGVYAFAIQIYCDFSGYSDIARGLGKTMGFDLIWNFNLPYFSKNPSEFWKRWHISLSTWLRDYLYIPLGGNRFGKIFTYRNLIITMLLGGLWHGAAWTFVLWGMYHGILLAGHRLIQPYLQSLFLNANKLVKNMFSVLSVVVMFNLVCLGWIFFRAGDLTTAFSMIGKIVNDFGDVNIIVVNELFVYIWVLIFVEVFQYFSDDLLAIYKIKPIIKWAFYFVCMLLMVVLGSYSGHSFIYFQF